MKNYYKILEVSENASIEVIDKAYRVLVKKYHPDLRGNTIAAQNKIKEINEAYNVLSDSFLKEQYDKELRQEMSQNNTNNFQESDYSRMYRERERQKYKSHQLENEDNEESINTGEEKVQKQKKKNEVGTSMGIVNLVKSLFRYRPTKDSIKSLKKVDGLALILTIIVMIGLGLLLYFLPFTHDWMVRNFIDTPLVNWFKNLF